MDLKPGETNYVLAQTVLMEQIQNNLYASKLCDANTQALLYAILSQYQIQYNEAHKQGQQVNEYTITIYEKDLEGFLKEISTAKTIRPQKLLEKKIQSVFALSNYTHIVEKEKISKIENMYTKFQLFVMKVVTEQIPYNILLEKVPQEILNANKIEDFQAIKAYTFTTTREGTDYINRMFGDIGTGYSYFLVGLSLTLKTETSKKVLNFLCKYMNAILAGQWTTGGQVVFTIDTVYNYCGIHSTNPKKNKDTLLKALEEVNNALLNHFSVTDKEGQPVQIKCKYLKNGEYSYNSWYKADKETHIQFYAQPIEDMDKLTKPNNTMKKIVDNANNIKDTFSTVKQTPKKEKDKKESQDNSAVIKEVIDYLNEKAGTKFRYNSKQTVGHINARLKEGYTIEDFKHVVDVKVYTWKNDPKMSAFIRPQTLFGTKMENYVNEKIKKPSWQVENDYVPNTKNRRCGEVPQNTVIDEEDIF